MIWPQLQTVAQFAIGRVLNSLPEQLFIALFAWGMLHILPRQNSGTRFAVWFMALLAVAGLPFASLPLAGGIAREHSLLLPGGVRPMFTLPGPWGLLLFLVWVLASLVAMLRLALGLWRLRALRRSCTAIDVRDLGPVIRETIAAFNSSRSVSLATSEHVSVPSVIGFFNPMIVIPAWALRELSPDELNIILLHEFAHVRRWDAWTNLLQKMVRAVFLFHPAVWWIEGRLSLEREMACDDHVLAETANPRGYAQCLIALLEKSVARRSWAMTQAAVNRAREASLRLAQILDVRRPNTGRIWKPALVLVALFSFVCLMAAPRAPQFVAFDGNARASHTYDSPALTLSRFQSPPALVIPAALHTSSSLSPKRIQARPETQVVEQPVEHPVEHPDERRRAAPRMVAAELGMDIDRIPARVTSVAAKQSVVPEETVLVIRTTQRVGPNAWVWSVCVWRVTWVNPSQVGAEREAVSHKT